MLLVTLVEKTYDLPGPLKPEQLRALAAFANTYGLRRFHVNEMLQQITFEYDASRLTEQQVTQILRSLQIPVEVKA